jgi:hypothetical protein
MTRKIFRFEFEFDTKHGGSEFEEELEAMSADNAKRTMIEHMYDILSDGFALSYDDLERMLRLVTYREDEL